MNWHYKPPTEYSPASKLPHSDNFIIVSSRIPATNKGMKTHLLASAMIPTHNNFLNQSPYKMYICTEKAQSHL